MIDRRTWLLWITFAVVASIPGAPVPAQGDLPVSSVQVVTDDGDAIAARLQIIRPGEPYPSVRVLFTDDGGKCDLSGVEAGKATLQVNHGPEWGISTQDIEIRPGGRQMQVALPRLYDLRARGYYQGDCHMHSTKSDGRQEPADVALHCRCEGLDFAFLTDHESVAGHAEFTAQATDDFLPLGGQEVTTSQGHILGLGVTEVVSRDLANGPEDMQRIFRQIGEQDGLSVLAHPMVPGMAYGYWGIEGFDVIEILNGSAPPYMGIFDMVQARLRWHMLLNEGKRISVVGNSDNHENYNSIVTGALKDPEAAIGKEPRLRLLWNMPNRDEIIIPWGLKGLFLGTYRTCVKMDGVTRGDVLAAIKAGKGFVTNGPIIMATVNGTDPGSEISGPKATVKFDAVCNRELERVVVLVNGKPAQTVDLTGMTAPGNELEVDIPAGSWLTVECYGKWPDFATTNAWYVK